MDHAFDIASLTPIKSWLGSGAINIFGRPFAGKDTQGKILSDLLDGPLLGGGDILRNSVIPERARAAMTKGLLIPTEDYLEIVLPYLEQPAFHGKPLILSSVGRWHGEEAGVIAATTRAKHPLKAVIYFDISEAAVWQRWQDYQDAKHAGDRGTRQDDDIDILKERLQEFQAKTLPVIDFYATTPLLIRIDAAQPGPEVSAQIFNALIERAQQVATEN